MNNLWQMTLFFLDDTQCYTISPKKGRIESIFSPLPLKRISTSTPIEEYNDFITNSFSLWFGFICIKLSPCSV